MYVSNVLHFSNFVRLILAHNILFFATIMVITVVYIFCAINAIVVVFMLQANLVVSACIITA